MTPQTSPPPGVQGPRSTIWDKLLKIDRRVIYLFLAVVVAFPLFTTVRIKPVAMEPVYALFNTIDSLQPDKAVVISVDYEPSTEAELQPMTIAVLRHAFARRTRVGVLALPVNGVGLAENALTQVVGEFNARARIPADSIRYGIDYVFWGFQTPPLMVLTGMGENINKVFPVDAYRNRTDSLPISEGLRTYNDIGIVVSIAGTSMPLSWITYAQTMFRVKIGTGVTAVSAADFYPYFSKTRQFSGIIAGMKGAAEYEEMVESRYPATGLGIPIPGATVKTELVKGKLVRTDLAGGTATVAGPNGEVTVPIRQVEFAARRRATEAMSSQTFAHLGIMLLILIGNVAFFASRGAANRRRKS
jgi:hypothetical protein